MVGIIHYDNLDPHEPVLIRISRLAAIRDITTTARHAPDLIADFRKRNDVRLLRVTAAGHVEVLAGPIARDYPDSRGAA